MYPPNLNKPHTYGSLRKVKNYYYNPLDSIGKGFSSVVYRGINQETSNKIKCMAACVLFDSQLILGEPVAIKAIDMKGVRDSAAKEMLEFQIQALTTLKHPNIMKCYDVVRESSHCYVITQLCNGGDLGELLKKRGRMSESETFKIMQDIAKGYIEIGDKGFLHRDLKLANVLMNNNQAKIADFGFAKKCRSQSIRQKYNVGSPLYMSPQALKSNIYSIKNDIWSLGIMAYELLHGDTPWQCKTEKELIDKMVRIPIKFKDSLKISSDMKDFIRKCLETDENKRMSLQGLRQWISEHEDNNPKQNNENVIAFQQPRLVQKNTMFQKLQSRPLSELTNKVPSQNSKSLNKLKPATNQNYQDYIPHQNKEATHNSQNNLTKSNISYNNNLLIKEIIVFRLYFKALQKIRNASELGATAQLKNILGNQTIRRVTLLKKLICSEDVSVNQHYSLKNVEAYLNPIYNPDIKKYKSVVNQYFNKYTAQIKMEVLQGKSTPSEIISVFLKNLIPVAYQKQGLLVHWLINLTKINKNFSKSELESILQPSREPNSMMLRQQIHEITCA